MWLSWVESQPPIQSSLSLATEDPWRPLEEATLAPRMKPAGVRWLPPTPASPLYSPARRGPPNPAPPQRFARPAPPWPEAAPTCPPGEGWEDSRPGAWARRCISSGSAGAHGVSLVPRCSHHGSSLSNHGARVLRDNPEPRPCLCGPAAAAAGPGLGPLRRARWWEGRPQEQGQAGRMGRRGPGCSTA